MLCNLREKYRMLNREKFDFNWRWLGLFTWNQNFWKSISSIGSIFKGFGAKLRDFSRGYLNCTLCLNNLIILLFVCLVTLSSSFSISPCFGQPIYFVADWFFIWDIFIMRVPKRRILKNGSYFLTIFRQSQVSIPFSTSSNFDLSLKI